MPDDLKTFAPTPQRVTFVIDGRPVPADLYNWQDLPVKEALAVWTLEEEMRGTTAQGWPVLVEYLRKILRLLCPTLEPEQLDALTPRQLQDAIGASHGVTLPPPDAGADAGTASPSASAASITPSPASSTGAPSTSTP